MRKYKIFLKLAEPVLGHTTMTWTHEFNEAHEAQDYLAEKVRIFEENNYHVVNTGCCLIDNKPVQLKMFDNWEFRYDDTNS